MKYRLSFYHIIIYSKKYIILMAKTIRQLLFLTYQRIIQFIGVFISHKTGKNTLFFNFHTFLNTIIFIPNVLNVIIILFATTLYPTNPPPPNLVSYY